jgi:hypothetical protein
MTRQPTAAVRDWFVREGFARARSDGYELAYAHSSGYGYVTLRFWPHDYGWDAIVSNGSLARPTGDLAVAAGDPAAGNYGVSLGTCQTLAQMAAVLALVRTFNRVHYVDTHGQRVDPRELLVERMPANGTA